MIRVGFLTSGGDCQSLNATMRGVAKTLYQTYDDTEIYGILEGYKGLIYGNYRKMKPSDFSLFLVYPHFLNTIFETIVYPIAIITNTITTTGNDIIISPITYPCPLYYAIPKYCQLQKHK